MFFNKGPHVKKIYTLVILISQSISLYCAAPAQQPATNQHLIKVIKLLNEKDSFKHADWVAISEAIENISSAVDLNSIVNKATEKIQYQKSFEPNIEADFKYVRFLEEVIGLVKKKVAK